MKYQNQGILTKTTQRTVVLLCKSYVRKTNKVNGVTNTKPMLALITLYLLHNVHTQYVYSSSIKSKFRLSVLFLTKENVVRFAYIFDIVYLY
jgi:hypothetical protein